MRHEGGLRKLFSTRGNIQGIKDEMLSVDRMCSDEKIIVSTFDQISRVSIRIPLRDGFE